MRSSFIPVRGTRYYQAGAAKASGRLRRGAALILVRQPENPHDCTAVAICLSDGTMLGHVPKERSAEFFEESAAGNIVSARIHTVRADAKRIGIDAEVLLSSTAPRATRSTVTIPAASSQPQRSFERPRPRLPTAVDTPPTSINQAPSGPAEGDGRWLWWAVGAIIVIWLLQK